MAQGPLSLNLRVLPLNLRVSPEFTEAIARMQDTMARDLTRAMAAMTEQMLVAGTALGSLGNALGPDLTRAIAERPVRETKPRRPRRRSKPRTTLLPLSGERAVFLRE